MTEFSAKIIDKKDVSVIYLAGFLDAHTAPILEDAFTNLVNDKKFKVVVNCKDLNYISSAGLGVFMAYIEKFRENNGDIKLAAMEDKIFNIFDLLGFPLLYDICKTEEEAINLFSENK